MRTADPRAAVAIPDDGVDVKPVPELLRQSTLPRDLVRKDGIDSVLLTDIAQVDDLEFVCAGQVSRAHALLNDTVPPRYDYYDLSMLTEVGRQALLAALHGPLGVPRSRKFVFTRLDVDATDPEPNDWMPYPVPLEVRVAVTVTEDDGEIRKLRPRLTWIVDGTLRARTGGAAQVYDRTGYEGMRRRALGARSAGQVPERSTVGLVDPAEVGRRNPANVLIGDFVRGDNEYRARIAVDETNPFYFDHPDEHVPGTMLVEAVRQMALLAASHEHGLDPARAVVASCRTIFVRFAELDVPAWCSARVGELEARSESSTDVTVRVVVDQEGSKVVVAALGLRFA